jgi:hypothetical protein
MSDEAKEVQEGIEVPEVTEAEPTAFATHGLLPQEVEMAKEHGLVEEESKEVDESSKEEEKKDDEHEEQPEAKTEDSEEEEPKTFDEVEKDEGGLKKFNPNEQALYWKWKSDKKKKQAAVKELEEYRSNHELSSIKEKSKLNKIAEALGNENVTVEQLQAIIGVNAEKGEDAPLTKSDLKEIEAEKEAQQKQLSNAEGERRDRIETAENIGNSKYGKEEFEELTRLTTELVNSKQGKTYKKLLETSFEDKDTSEEEIVEQIATLAKLNPDYGKESDVAKKATPETDADRAIKNSKKKISSATVGSGSGKTTVSEDDITVDQAATLTPGQWNKLKSATRKRLLM